MIDFFVFQAQMRRKNSFKEKYKGTRESQREIESNHFPDDEAAKLSPIAKLKQKTLGVKKSEGIVPTKTPKWKKKTIPEVTPSMDYDPIQAAGK